MAARKDTDAHPAGGVTTVSELLRRRAAELGDRLAYAFLGESGEDGARLDYRTLDTRARAIAVELHRADAAGQRAVLLLPPGPDFVTAFFGCLHAGTVAVPAYPPDPFRLERTLPRLLACVRDAAPVVALTTSELLPYAEQLSARAPELAALRWLAVDGVPDSSADGWAPPASGGDSVALLQYTSGSTAEPRGVVLSHGNLLHNSRLIQELFRSGPGSRGLSWLPPYHDMGLIGGLLQPLYGGFPVWLMSPLEFLRDPLRWLQAIARVRATHSGGPNFAFDLCVRKTTPEQRASLDLSSWRVAFNGAEPIRRGTLERFAEAFAPAGFATEAFLPCYGLAEATLIVTGGTFPSAAGAVDRDALARGEVVPDPRADDSLTSCGRPAGDQRVAVVHPDTLEPCPPDRVGEIWVAGPSVAQGYWGRPDETRQVFRARVAGGGGEAFLRTGDLGFVRDGELVVTGRIKDVLVVRGRNHYPQDVELTAEQAHPALRPGGSAAFLAGDGGEEHLTLVHEVARQATGVDVTEVAAALRQAVATHHDLHVRTVVLVPAGALPKTSSGKVQRQRCRRLLAAGELEEAGRSAAAPEPLPAAPAPSAAAVRAAPPGQRRALLEGYLRARTAAACGVAPPELDPARPLLAVGLDSLAAHQLAQDVEADLGVRSPLAEVLAGATLAEAVDLIDARVGAGDAAPAPAPGAPGRPSGSLSYGQRSLWFLHQLEPGSSAHTIAAALRLTGRLDRAALRRAVEAVVARHPMLRTTFAVRDGQPRQVVHAHGAAGYHEHEAGDLDDAGLAARLSSDAREPFDLGSGPLLRLHLYRRSDDDHALLCVAHHVVADFWSVAILCRELEALYGEHGGGPAAALPAPAASYDDFVAWQHALAHGPDGTEAARYWQRQLPGALPPLRLPELGAGAASSRAGTVGLRVGEALTAGLRRRAAAEGTTLYVLLLAAYQALLHRWTGQQDLAVGTPFAARTRREFAGVVGYCMNPVVIRSQAGAACTLRELLERTRAQVVGGLEHQDYPSSLLAERSAGARPGGRLFETMFVFNRPPPTGGGELALLMVAGAGVQRPFGPLQAEPLPLEPTATPVDLELMLAEVDGALHGSVRFRLDRLDGPAAELLAGQYTRLLEQLVADPERQLGSLLRADGEEREQAVARTGRSGAPDGDGALVHHLVQRQARRAPEATAVLGGDSRLSYGDLEARANQLAHLLRAAGIGPGARVGLLLERSPDLLVALLGVLKSGAAYVPVDPLHPDERIAAMFADACVDAVVSQDALAGKVPRSGARAVLLDREAGELARQPATSPPPAATAADLAYVVYTSGSTGTPKGVAVTHAALANYIRFATAHYEVGAGDRVLQFASIGFDASAEEIYTALAGGATLVLRSDTMLADPARFLAGCEAQGVTVLGLPTAFWHDLVSGMAADGLALPAALRLVIIGGERALPERVAAWRDHAGDAVRLVNTYGPTEATIVATCCDLTGPGAPPGAPIGRPVAGVRALVLDDDRQPVSPGVVGELYLGGAGLARGYLGQPALTAERFVADPTGAAGSRLYRTGDLVRRRPDGCLDYVDRRDRQVKLQGYRVELGEIEAALRRHADVGDAVALLHGDGGQLVAYVTAAGADAPPAGALRASLRASLPEYMVPRAFVALPALPRLPSGKVDSAALPAPDLRRDDTPGGDPPQTPEEQALARIWADVLGLGEIRRHDDFFALGGHSLLATRVLARAADALGVELPLRAVFESPTLAGLAARIGEAPRSRALPMSRAPRDEPLPLSFAQESIWFLQHFEPGSTNYNVPRALRITGDIDLGVLGRVLADLEERHEILRTTFPDVDGVPVQRIHEPRGIPVRLLDHGALAEHEREQRVAELVLELGREPFDLTEGPLLRVNLVRLAPQEHVLVVVEHHLVHDGWTQGVFLRDFLELYAARTSGRPARLPELPVQYADFASWQRRTVRGGRLDELLDFWRGRLDGAPPVLPLPTDRPRPKVLTTSRGDQETLVLTGDLARSLRELCRETGATLFMVTFSAFAMLLYGYSGQRDVVVGAGIANRQRPELDNLLGMIINTVVLRADLSGGPSFLALLDRVRRMCLECYDYQDMPFEKLVEHLRPARALSYTPLFQVMFSFLDTPMPALRIPGLEFEVLDAHNRTAKFDLNVVIQPHAEQRFQYAGDASDATDRVEDITVMMEYNAELFAAATIRGMLDRFERLLRASAADPLRTVEDHLGGVGLTPAVLTAGGPAQQGAGG